MPLILSPVLADRFTRIMAMLCGMIAEHGARRRSEDRLAFVIQAYVRQLARRFLARATALPGPRENVPRGPRAPVAQPAAPRVPPEGPRLPPEGPQLPRGQAWLVKRMQPSIAAFSQLKALLREPEVVALLAARPNLLRILAPLHNSMAYPPEPRMGVPRRRKPEPDPANPDAAGTDASGTGATGTQAKPPRKPRKRKFRFSRREDLLFRLRMGKPIPEF